MKKIVVSILAPLLIVSVGQSQNPKEQPILTAYYSVNDALVKGDDKAAAVAATELVKQLDGFATSDKKVEQLKAKIRTDASKIAGGSLSAQREAFTPMSANFLELAKLVDLSPAPIYQFYCPMKKATWLSPEKAVRNPYYGKQMLTCGSLQQTIE